MTVLRRVGDVTFLLIIPSANALPDPRAYMACAMLYRIPLPDNLDGVATLRTITITLAWFSPVNTRHQGYRMAALDIASGSEPPTRSAGRRLRWALTFPT